MNADDCLAFAKLAYEAREFAECLAHLKSAGDDFAARRYYAELLDVDPDFRDFVAAHQNGAAAQNTSRPVIRTADELTATDEMPEPEVGDVLFGNALDYTVIDATPKGPESYRLLAKGSDGRHYVVIAEPVDPEIVSGLAENDESIEQILSWLRTSPLAEVTWCPAEIFAGCLYRNGQSVSDDLIHFGVYPTDVVNLQALGFSHSSAQKNGGGKILQDVIDDIQNGRPPSATAPRIGSTSSLTDEQLAHSRISPIYHLLVLLDAVLETVDRYRKEGLRITKVHKLLISYDANGAPHARYWFPILGLGVKLVEDAKTLMDFIDNMTLSDFLGDGVLEEYDEDEEPNLTPQQLATKSIGLGWLVTLARYAYERERVEFEKFRAEVNEVIANFCDTKWVPHQGAFDAAARRLGGEKPREVDENLPPKSECEILPGDWNYSEPSDDEPPPPGEDWDEPPPPGDDWDDGDEPPPPEDLPSLNDPNYTAKRLNQLFGPVG